MRGLPLALSLLVAAGCRTTGPPAPVKWACLLGVAGASSDERGLTADSPRLRQWSVLRLVARGRADLAPEIAALVSPRTEENAAVRLVATSAVRSFAYRPAAQDVAANLKDPDFLLRLESAKTLAVIGGPAETEGLLAVLEDPAERPELRIQAAEALGRIGDARAARGLVACLAAPEPSLRFAARRALTRMAASDFGGSAENWLPWLKVKEAVSSGAAQ